MNATVRDNILFSHIDDPVDEDLYQKALDCCALRHDLTLLPYGDETEIGEKGVTMSGGQKARVALARAMYHQGDITLVDDALAAVDAHVAEQLFEEAIVKELMRPFDGKPRSVVLVTNAIQYLSHSAVDRIVVIQDGRIAEQGTYKELAERTESIFARFLAVLEDTGVSAGELTPCSPVEEDVVAAIRRDSVAKRRSSVKTVEVVKPRKATTEEVRATGRVDLDVYKAWAAASGGLWVPFVVLIAFAGDAGVAVVTKWWLTYWSSHGNSGRSQTFFLAIYALINLGAALFSLLRQLFLAVVALVASRRVSMTSLHCPRQQFRSSCI